MNPEMEWHVGVVLAALGPRPATKTYLSVRTGLSGRDIEKAVQTIRTLGIANVASSSDGYWMANTVAELTADIERGERRIRTMLATRRGQKRLLRKLRESETYRASLWDDQ